MAATVSIGRRILLFPVVRIVVAATPIALLALIANFLVDTRHWRNSNAGTVLSLVVSAATVALYVGYVRLVERRPVTELGGDLASAAGEAGRGFALGATLFAVTIGILMALGVCSVGRGDGWGAAGAALVGAVGAAIGEEILLRAIFFRIVEEGLGTWLALALSAALFGLLHAPNSGATVVSSAAIALEAGVLLAAAYTLTRRLWLPMGLHAAWNFTEGGLFGASVSGTTPHGLLRTQLAGPPLLTGGAFGPEASLVAVLVCLAAGVVLLAAARARGRFILPAWRRRAATAAPVA
jgi:membrane protease YdiL (CAAX protease family)